MNRLALAAGSLLLLGIPARAAGALPKDGQRVVFLGDSITNAGMYVQNLDFYLMTQFPDRKVELINLGLPSENITGLSEPGHPFPRPNVHERLGRVLEKTKPDIVVACYGMNDGIYYPFDEGRFAQYQRGIRTLIEKVKQAGAEVVLVTPPPFDARPVRNNTRPAGAESYSWAAPYEDYDQTLERYAEWLLTLRGEGIRVVDARGALVQYLKLLRAHNPDATLAGDGVHLNAMGHRSIANALRRAWDGPIWSDRAKLDAESLRVEYGPITDLARDGGSLRFTWTTPILLPWPADLPIPPDRWFRGRERSLYVTGLALPRYELSEGGNRLATVDGERLAKGIGLADTAFPDLSVNRRAVELRDLVAKRERLLTAAWLSAVGHTRPGVAPGLPLEEAKRQAAALEAKARELARPVALKLELTPAGR